uniref:LAGLIDADG endonuclease n=1 Tax=Juglanconis juglandina TaxID=1940567 RepID=A0A291LJ45_9PEZI|nr:LAGLIDADG endonuclease [Juglanconis juglandina]
MGTFNLLFFLCVKEHYARNLLLLLNTIRILSHTHLTSSRSYLFSTYRRLSGTRGSIASVNHNRTFPHPLIPSKEGIKACWGVRGSSLHTSYAGGIRYTTRLSSIIPQQTFWYSIDHNKIHPISPWFITGFTDAPSKKKKCIFLRGALRPEGCFNVGLQKNPNGKFYVRPKFQIKVHSRDSLLLMRIKNYFGGIGNINTNSKDSSFTVRSLDDILKIILHFDNYPLITKKKADFILFKQIIHKVIEGEHLSAKGLQEIVNIRSSMNLGLSDSLKTVFPNTVSVNRPEIENITIPHPEWMAGFVTGEGCFLVQMSKYGKGKLDGVSFSFKVSQHLRDELLLRSFITFFGCGLFNYHSGKSKHGSGVFLVRKFADISDKIIPFFQDHMIEGIKREDFEDWSRVVELVRSKAHLTEEGVNNIREIKSGLNTLR